MPRYVSINNVHLLNMSTTVYSVGLGTYTMILMIVLGAIFPGIFYALPIFELAVKAKEGDT